MAVATTLAGLAILVGLVGIVVPVLPGALLVWGAVVVWALVTASSTGAAFAWTVAGVATVIFALGWGLQYLLPGRRLRAAGVPDRTTVVGLVAGLIGFFVVPVVGLPLFFVLGVYLCELARVGSGSAWTSTFVAARAALLSYGIEVVGGLAMAATWVVAVIVAARGG